MIFTSLTFLLFFIVLAVFLRIYKSTESRINILLVSSYIFYGAWNVTFLLLIFASSLWGWYLGLLMSRTESRRMKKLYLLVSLVLSLGTLSYFKYANFFVDSVFGVFGVDRDHTFDILLPVGISFFTFQTMSYTIDLYRNNIEVCYSLKKFMLFVAFFPQLVAGPIVRASDFLPQLAKNIQFNSRDILIGAQIFLGGAIQKVLFADNLSQFVDPVFENPSVYDTTTLWVALLSYSLQIFCDFCGYSLMAIGIAKMLGFHLPQNFNMPYISMSITEFWRRWHISLSSWLRDYLYISLGGNRKGKLFTYRNLMITMLLGGLWHGASWNFVLWGGGHGLALAVHKVWQEYGVIKASIKELKVYKLLSWAVTLLVVMLLWVPFRSSSYEHTTNFMSGLFTLTDGITWISAKSILLIALAFIWHIAFFYKVKPLMSYPTTQVMNWSTVITVTLSLTLFLLFAPLNASPFIYFQF